MACGGVEPARAPLASLGMADGRFVTVVSCIDGRVQEPLARWAKARYGADWADMITRPGCDGVLSDGDAASAEQVRADVEVSVRAHSPVALVVSGHHDCAANPGTQTHHLPQIRRAVLAARGWGLGVEVVGAWVDEDWAVRAVDVED